MADARLRAHLPTGVPPGAIPASGAICGAQRPLAAGYQRPGRYVGSAAARRRKPASGAPCALYDVRVALPSNVVVGLVAVETSLAGQSIQVLIGRDVLQQGVLVYVGYTGTFTFRI